MKKVSLLRKSEFRMFILFLLIFYSGYAACQSITIKGVVIDEKTGHPLPFASLGLKGTMIGVASNGEGQFIMSVPGDMIDSVLICSFMGYKNFEIKVSNLTNDVIIKMTLDTFTLEEIEVRPWLPWDYVRNAVQKIPNNYSAKAYMTKEYYSEYISENGTYLKFTEAILESFNPPYMSDSSGQSKVLKARRGEELGSLQFMREKLEKKFEKERRKTEKKGEVWEEKESIDEAIISASFGGPEVILGADPLRDTASYLNVKHHKKYKYTIEGYSKYYGEQVIIIGFESKGKIEHERQKGNIYISLECDAVAAVEYTSTIVIPAAIRPVIFLLGYGISNPILNVTVHYKPILQNWYLNDISISGGVSLTKKKMFKKNDKSQFQLQMTLINTLFDLDNVYEINEEERVDPEKPLEDQVEADSEFWRTYKVIRPPNLK